MALTNLSQITNSGISTLADINLNNITGVAATFTGNVTVGGTLTYDDVTNIDSVGLVTARSGVSITGGDLTLPDSIIHAGDTNTKIRFPAADTFSVETAGSERLRITSAGLVGIGTDNPSGNLTVSTVGGSTLTLQRDDTSTSADRKLGEIVFRGNDNSGAFEDCAKIIAISDKGHSDGDKPTNLEFHTTPDNSGTPVERLHITSEGLVGINTTTGFDTSVGLAVRNGASSSDHTMIDIIANTNESSRLVFSDDADHNQGRLQYNHTGNSLSFYTNGNNERLRIDSDGKVGIGSANPTAHLQVYRATQNASNPIIQARSNNGSTNELKFEIDGDGDAYFNGNVGIGTDNPDTLLNLFGTGNTTIKVHNNSSIVGTYSRLQLITGGPGSSARSEIRSLRMFSSTAATDLAFFTTVAGGSSPTERLRITSAGKVGIGTDNPTAHLQVYRATQNASNPIIQARSNNGSTNELKFEIDGDGDAYFNGKVGIGTDDPGNLNGNGDDLVIGNGVGNRGITIFTGANGTGNIYFADGTTGSAPLRGGITYVHDDNHLKFLTNASEKLRITSAGLVGISDSDPRTGLTINKYGTIPTSNANTYSYPAGRWVSTWNTGTANNTDYWAGFGAGGYGVSSGSVNIALATNHNNTSQQAGMYIAGETISATSADFTIGKIVAGSAIGSSDVAGNQRATKSELMRITSSGEIVSTNGTLRRNVSDSSFTVSGDTASNTGANINLYGASHSSLANVFRIRTGSTERLRITSDGKIGINNSAPLHALHFKNAMSSSPSFIHMEVTGSNTVGGGGGIAFDTSASNSQPSGANHLYLATIAGIRNSADNGSNDLVFSTTEKNVNSDLPVEKLRITSDGKLSLTGSTANMEYLRMGGNNDRGLRFTSSSGSSSVGVVHTINAPGDSGNQGAIVLQTNSSERLRITSDGDVGIGGVGSPGALLHLRDSQNTTKGAAQLKISKGVGSGAAPTSVSRADSYIHLGGSEWGSGANGLYIMGLGYTNGETGTGLPAYIGFKETSTSGYTLGDLTFGTRPNTDGTNVGRERMRITSKGVRQYPCANDSSFAYQGNYQQLSGKKQLIGSGNFTDIVVHGHSCSYLFQYHLVENDNNSLGGGPGTAFLHVRYGASGYSNHVHHVAGMNGGSLNSPEIVYVNSGSKLTFRASWSGSNPVFLYWHLSGCGNTLLTAL